MNKPWPLHLYHIFVLFDECLSISISLAYCRRMLSLILCAFTKKVDFLVGTFIAARFLNAFSDSEPNLKLEFSVLASFYILISALFY